MTRLSLQDERWPGESHATRSVIRNREVLEGLQDIVLEAEHDEVLHRCRPAVTIPGGAIVQRGDDDIVWEASRSLDPV